MRKIGESPVVFGVVLLAALGLIFYMLLGRGSVDVLVEQTLHREQAITRAGAASIRSFLSLAGKSLALVSGDEAVRNFKPEAEEDMKVFVKQWEGTPILGMSLVDNLGMVRLTVNQNGTTVGTGRSVADRDYFSKAMTSVRDEIVIGKAVISRVGQSEGRFVVPFAAPMHDRKGKFLGVVISSTVIEELTKYYLDPLKISDQTGVHLVTDDGTILYSSNGPKTRESLLEYIRSRPFLGSGVLVKKVEEWLKKGEEGKLDLAWPGERGWQRNLVAYSPIKIEEGRYWYVVLTTPVDDALAFMGPLYVRVLVAFAAVFLALLAYAVRLARHFASEERRKYEHEKHGIKE